MKYFILICTFLTSFNLYAAFSSYIRKHMQEISITAADGTIIKGLILPGRSDKTPILTIHGFTGSTEHWNVKATSLHKQGHTVCLLNMRGHGKGHHRSLSPTGEYGFDKIVTQDIPAMIDYLHTRTNKRIAIIGHSMGGMTSTLYMSGIRESADGIYKLSAEQAAEWWSSRVKVLFSIAAPTTFDNDWIMYRLYQFIVKHFPQKKEMLINSILKTLTNGQTITPNRIRPHNIQTFVKYILRRVKYHINDRISRTRLARRILGGLVKTENLSPRELKGLSRGLSVVLESLIQDTARWGTFGYTSRDGAINYEKILIPRNLDYVYIAGSDDLLANPNHMLDHLRLQGDNPNLLFLELQGFSHGDVIGGERSSRLILPIIETISEEGVQSAEATRLIESLSSASQILVKDRFSQTTSSFSCLNLLKYFL